MDLPVGVVLKVLEGIQTTVRLEREGIEVRVSTGLVHDAIADLKSATQSLQTQNNDLVIVRKKKSSQSVQETLLHQKPHLIVSSPRDSVGNGPGDLLTDLKLSLVHQLQKDRANVALQSGLDLSFSTGSDVRDSPSTLFQDIALSSALHNLADRVKGSEVEGGLGLLGRSGDDVTDGTEGGGDNGLVVGPHQLDETRDKTGLDNSLDAIIFAVSDIRNSPAGITQDFFVLEVEKSVQGVQAATDKLKLGSGLSTNQVRQSPGTVAKEGFASANLQVLDEGRHSSTAQNVVSGLARVSSDVTEGPGGLFFVLPLLSVLGHGDKGGDGSRLEDDFGVFAGSRGDVGKGPGGFEFDIIISTGQQLDEAGDSVVLDNLIDRGLSGTRQHLSQRTGSLQAQVLVLVVEDHLDQLGKVGIRGDSVKESIFGSGLFSFEVDVSTLEGKFLTLVLADLGALFDTAVTGFLGIKTLLEASPPLVLAGSGSSVHLLCVVV